MLSRTHLPGFLRYEDRNSMAFSIEARVPFLDHRLVELAFALADEETLGRGRSKRVLRAAVAPLVPETVAARRDKVGFATPESRWLSESLGDRLAALEREPGPWLDSAGLADLRVRAACGSLRAARALWRALSVERWREVMKVVA
jgi:asparagine synthase (glutamine-hydrolysing)